MRTDINKTKKNAKKKKKKRIQTIAPSDSPLHPFFVRRWKQISREKFEPPAWIVAASHVDTESDQSTWRFRKSCTCPTRRFVSIISRAVSQDSCRTLGFLCILKILDRIFFSLSLFLSFLDSWWIFDIFNCDSCQILLEFPKFLDGLSKLTGFLIKILELWRLQRVFQEFERILKTLSRVFSGI